MSNFATGLGAFDKINHALAAFHRNVKAGSSDVISLSLDMMTKSNLDCRFMFTSYNTANIRLQCGDACWLWKGYATQSCKDDPKLQGKEDSGVAVSNHKNLNGLKDETHDEVNDLYRCYGCAGQFKRYNVLYFNEGYMCTPCANAAGKLRPCKTQIAQKLKAHHDQAHRFPYTCHIGRPHRAQAGADSGSW